MKACIRCLVSGRVQGVSFRAAARAEAQRLGVTGWAQNLPDGRVAVLACGDSDQLDAYRQWLHQGPPAARVDGVDEEERAPQEAPADFGVR